MAPMCYVPDATWDVMSMCSWHKKRKVYQKKGSKVWEGGVLAWSDPNFLTRVRASGSVTIFIFIFSCLW
jgi:hypothetical protein